MTTIKGSAPLPAVEAPEDWSVGDPPDPFRYGWRYVYRTRPDGSVAHERVGLTLEDVLHPQEEDFIVQSEAHHRRGRYLCDLLSARLADDPSAVVLGDVRIAWDVPRLKAHGPDVAVILGVRERKNWGTFDVAEEGTRPSLIIELVSPATVGIDRVNKVEDYDLAGVDQYVIVDLAMLRDPMTLRLTGYTRTPSGYQLSRPNERGWLWLDVVRVWLGIADNEIVCYDESGAPLGDYTALAAAYATEQEARLVAEQQREAEQAARLAAEDRANAAEARIRELEEAVRRLQGGR